MSIQQQKQSKILIIGDSCLDEYIFGDCTRVSPEAPVPVILHTSKTEVEGMALNVLRNFENISNTEQIIVTNDPNKIRKIRFVDNKSKYQIMRYDIEEKVVPCSSKKIPESDFDAIIISDYNKGFVTEETLESIRNKHKKTRIFVDTKRKDVSMYSGCTLKLNESEYREAKGKDDSMEFIVTLGKKGALWKGEIYPTRHVEVHDVCGAGDVFLSSMVWKWIHTKSMKDSIKFANKCASYSVTKQGTYKILPEEYERLKNEK